MTESSGSTTRATAAQRLREWVRFKVAYAVSWPLWQFSAVGGRAARLHDRIIEWGERAR